MTTANPPSVNFVTMMIPHHAQAIELAGLVDGRSANAELITLAGNVKNAQQPEIDTMKSMLRSWGYADDQADGNGHGGHGGHQHDDAEIVHSVIVHTKAAHHNRGCSWGLNPPVSSRLRAM